MRLFLLVLFGLASAAQSKRTIDDRPDSRWDFTLRGSKWHSERKIEPAVSSYKLRGKAVDPSSLNIDTVQQYVGYLDDDQNNKHLFYCKTQKLLVCFQV